MRIIAHRGYWFSAQEKNTEVAFYRAFSMGFGTETDGVIVCNLWLLRMICL